MSSSSNGYSRPIWETPVLNANIFDLPTSFFPEPNHLFQFNSFDRDPCGYAEEDQENVSPFVEQLTFTRNESYPVNNIAIIADSRCVYFDEGTFDLKTKSYSTVEELSAPLRFYQKSLELHSLLDPFEVKETDYVIFVRQSCSYRQLYYDRYGKLQRTIEDNQYVLLVNDHPHIVTERYHNRQFHITVQNSLIGKRRRFAVPPKQDLLYYTDIFAFRGRFYASYEKKVFVDCQTMKRVLFPPFDFANESTLFLRNKNCLTLIF